MSIQIYIKNVYGSEKIYIKDAEQAKIIMNLTGKKTIDQNDINNLKKLGCTFELVTQSYIIL